MKRKRIDTSLDSIHSVTNEQKGKEKSYDFIYYSDNVDIDKVSMTTETTTTASSISFESDQSEEKENTSDYNSIEFCSISNDFVEVPQKQEDETMGKSSDKEVENPTNSPQNKLSKWLLDNLTEEEETVPKNLKKILKYIEKNVPSLKKISEVRNTLSDEQTIRLIERYNIYQATDCNETKLSLKKDLNSEIKSFVEKPELAKLEVELEEYIAQNENIKEQILKLDTSLANKAVIYEKYLKKDREYHQGKLESWLYEILQYPFGKVEPMSELPLKEVQEELNTKVDFMDEAKNKIINYVAKLMHNPKSKGEVLCLEGAAGVGKTHLCNSLGKVLNRPCKLIPCGGISEMSVLSGHSYTVEGSQPGAIFQTIQKSGVLNPIIILDEIDKIARTEISNQLVHILDYTQNNEFMDSYFQGITLDLSNVLFICTLNNSNNVCPILKDRMNIIKIESPSYEQKVVITKSTLLPQIYKEYLYEGIITDGMIRYVINKTLESGVRDLKRSLETVVAQFNTETLKGNNPVLDYKFIDNALKSDKKELTLSMYL